MITPRGTGGSIVVTHGFDGITRAPNDLTDATNDQTRGFK